MVQYIHMLYYGTLCVYMYVYIYIYIYIHIHRERDLEIHIVVCYVVYVMLCYVVLCFVVLCYVMLCYVMVWIASSCKGVDYVICCGTLHIYIYTHSIYLSPSSPSIGSGVLNAGAPSNRIGLKYSTVDDERTCLSRPLRQQRLIRP